MGMSVAACSGTKHSGKNASLPGAWQAQPIVIDGDSHDWPSPYPSYDAKALVGYATSNDKDNLYITVETGDEATQMKILKQGLTVWIDTTGRKNEQMGIHYPLQDLSEPFEMQGRKRGEGAETEKENEPIQRDFGRSIKRSISNATQITFEGFKDCNGGFLVTQNNPCGIKVRIAMDEYKELIWEAAIPFKAIYGREQITKEDAGKPISVCFAVKGFKQPSSSHSDNSSDIGTNSSMGGMRSGGMGSMRGGGMRHGGMQGGREAMFESTHTWKTFGLAYEQ